MAEPTELVNVFLGMYKVLDLFFINVAFFYKYIILYYLGLLLG